MRSSPSQAIVNLTQFDGAIFDLDGVVTKTARVHAAAWKNVFDEFLQNHALQTGQPFQPFDLVHDYRQYVDGKPRYEGVRSFLASRGVTLPFGDPSDTPDMNTICGLGNRKNSMFVKALQSQGVETFPATIALIIFLKSRGRKTAVVTASENCHHILQAAHLLDLFDVSVDGIDARTSRLPGKPHPATFLRAAERLGMQPQRAIIFEDSLAGVEAGRAGDFGVVVGIDRAGHAQALRDHGADVVVQDVVELGIQDLQGVCWLSARARPAAIQHLEEIQERVAGTRLFVFLDYDGTLTPIVERPDLAVLSPDMRHVLKEVSHHYPVAIITGRDRQDVENLVNIDSLIYAGSHGFDIAGPDGLQIQHEVGIQFTQTLDQAEQTLRGWLQSLPGCLIERKKFSIAVHYRLVDRERIGEVDEAVSKILSAFPTLRRSEGKKVFEIQPNVEWDKGKALKWLLDKLNWKENRFYPLYIGDDLTDEDAFRELQEIGIPIVVEDGYRFTCAHYRLGNTGDVQSFLTFLTSMPGNSPA